MQFPSIAKISASLLGVVSNVRRSHLWQTKKLHCNKAFLLISFTQRILFLYKNICTTNCNELFQTIRHYIPSYIGVSFNWGTILQKPKSDLLCFCKQYWSWLFVLLSPAETNTETQDSASCMLNKDSNKSILYKPMKEAVCSHSHACTFHSSSSTCGLEAWCWKTLSTAGSVRVPWKFERLFQDAHKC